MLPYHEATTTHRAEWIQRIHMMTPTKLRLRCIKTNLNWVLDGEVFQEELSNLQTRVLLLSRHNRNMVTKYCLCLSKQPADEVAHQYI